MRSHEIINLNEIYLDKRLNRVSIASKTEMRATEFITEAPLQSYTTMGDFEKPGPFSGPDKKLVPHPVNILKTQQFFSKTHDDFRLFFANIPGTRNYREAGVVNDDVIKALFKDQSDKILTGSDNAITVVYLGNYGDAKVPLTPWVMAHRFGHAIQASGPSRAKNRWAYAENHFFKAINEILKEYYGKIFTNSNAYMNRYEFRKEYAALFNAIGTQRSSRTNLIKRPYEFLYEIFAQYLGTGTVKFNPLPVQIGYGRKAWGRATNYLIMKQEMRDEQQRASVTDTLAYDMELLFNDVLSSSVGSIFLM